MNRRRLVIKSQMYPTKMKTRRTSRRNQKTYYNCWLYRAIDLESDLKRHMFRQVEIHINAFNVMPFITAVANNPFRRYIPIRSRIWADITTSSQMILIESGNRVRITSYGLSHIFQDGGRNEASRDYKAAGKQAPHTC